MPGYSGTPLAKKLGIKPGHRLCLLAAPSGFSIPNLPDDVKPTKRAPAEVVLLFVKARREMDRLIPLRATMPQDGCIWVCWPKKASGAATDVTEDTVRDVALPAGLVDVKVCAVDDTWSGLKLVIPLKDRAE